MGFARESDAEAVAEQVGPELLRGEPGSEAAVEARLDIHIWAAAPGQQRTGSAQQVGGQDDSQQMWKPRSTKGTEMAREASH